MHQFFKTVYHPTLSMFAFIQYCTIHLPGKEVSLEDFPREAISYEVADVHTSCGDLRIKSNMSSPEPASQQFFPDDDVVNVSSYYT